MPSSIISILFRVGLTHANRSLILTRANFLCLLVIGNLSLFAQAAPSPFTAKDVFRTSVFLQNNDIVENHMGDRILYFTDHDYISAFLTEKGVIYKASKVGRGLENYKKNKEDKEDGKSVPIRTSTVYMKWVGANPHPKIIAERKEKGYYTYLKKDKQTFKSLITSGYKAIVYKDLYPGIDAKYYFPEKGGLEYNLIVHPGADVGKVRITYAGNAMSLQMDKDGNVVIHTESGDIVEHAPVSFSGDNLKIATKFSLKGTSFRFNFPNNYDRTKTLVIDPWVTVLTTLPPLNMGMDVDYDLEGNLFVYGAGSTYTFDFTNFFQVAKYDINGNALWTFNGTVPSVAWSSGIYYLTYPSNLIVDKVSSKVYVGKGFDPIVGTSAIRLNSSGQYDNFISSLNLNFTEIWGFAFNCATGKILALGGGITSPLTMGVINTSTGETVTSNITGLDTSNYQDIVCGTYDSAGSFYVIMNSSGTQLPYPNTIYKVNGANDGHVWLSNSGFASFFEVYNVPYWDIGQVLNGTNYGAGNWSNALSANGSYLYCYDGHNISAYHLADGSMAGASYGINGYDPLYQGGVAVDNCNHVYVGGVGVIKTYTFNDSIFVAGPDISLGSGFENDTIHDVKYNAINKLLYVAGKSIVGTYASTYSTNCYTRPPFDFKTYKDCNTISVQVKPDPGLSPRIFTYIWMDSANNVISRLDNTTDTVNVLDHLHSGTYYIQIQWNVNCGGEAATDTIHLGIEVDHVLYCPNAFSPNGDGNNDAYYAYAKGFHDFILSIFDRWGEKVFETPNINKGWDGTFQSNNSPEGVYSYVVSTTFNDGCILKKKGSITLIR